jgi:hypothetical protein
MCEDTQPDGRILAEDDGALFPLGRFAGGRGCGFTLGRLDGCLIHRSVLRIGPGAFGSLPVVTAQEGSFLFGSAASMAAHLSFWTYGSFAGPMDQVIGGGGVKSVGASGPTICPASQQRSRAERDVTDLVMTDNAFAHLSHERFDLGRAALQFPAQLFQRYVFTH